MRTTRTNPHSDSALVAVGLVLAVVVAGCSDDSPTTATSSDAAASKSTDHDDAGGVDGSDTDGHAALGSRLRGGADRRCRQLRRHGPGPGRHRRVEQPGAVDPRHRGDGGDLVDTLNGAGPFTIFAPANDAFAKIPADTLERRAGRPGRR